MNNIPVTVLEIPTEETPWIIGYSPNDGWTFENACITVTFSHTLDASANLSKYIRIEPFVPCRINCYDQNILYIKPHEFLDYNMVYTVTVFPGVPTVNGKRTKVGTSFSFRVENTCNTPWKTSRNIGDHIRLSLPDGGHDITVHANREMPLRLTAQNPLWRDVPKIVSYSAHCTVYRYHNAKEAVQALLGYEKNKWRHHCDMYRFPFRHLEKTDEYILENFSGKSPTDPRMYEFDLTVRPLPPGCYLLRCRIEAVYPQGVYEPYELPKTICGQIILQMSDRSADTEIRMEMLGDMLQLKIPDAENLSITAHLYSISDDGLNRFIHVKDAASIRTLSCRTDKAGTVLMQTFGKNRALVLFGKGTKAFFRRFSWDTPKVPERNIHIDTDRIIYGFSDTIHFSGTVTPWEGLHHLYLFTDLTKKAIPVSVQADGSFSDKISYSVLAAYKIALWLDEPGKGEIAWIERQIRDVFHQNSPVWMALDKTEFCRGEPVSATIHAVNVDGTPAIGQEFRWYCMSDDQSSGAYGRICTDESGTAHIVFVPKEINGSSPGTDSRKNYTFDVNSVSGKYFWEKERFVYEK